MAQLRRDHGKFGQRGAEVVVVGPEGPAGFRVYWERARLPFVGLPDPEHSVLKLYGQQVKLFKLGRLPAQVIVDAAGIARWAHYGHAMSDIPANADVLALLDELGAPKP
jgi:peroxiredoxin Q/BCP